MTRRDRAAMVLAYQLLCGCGYDEQSITETLRCADNLDMWAAWVSACDSGVRLRLLRARLALALRVLLRADAGDYGPRWERCDGCGYDSRDRWAVEWRLRGNCRRSPVTSRSYAPLWDLAAGAGRRHPVTLRDVSYRQPAATAPIKPEPLRRVLVGGHRHEVHPHGFGRWSCPACGAWRWLALFTMEPEHATGRCASSDGSVTPCLYRECPRCQYRWFVEFAL